MADPVTASPASWADTRFGYVCGALRVSTDPSRGSIGPRAHVTGFLQGLRDVGVDPRVYLAGDQEWAARLSGDGSDAGGAVDRKRMLVNDSARLALRPVFQQAARRRTGPVEVVYERQATFQDVGRPMQRRGAFWVVESNGPFWYEASVERGNLALTGPAKRLELNAYRDADLVVVVSQALKEIIVEHVGRSPEDVLVLPNATDPARFDPDSVTPRRCSAMPTLGFSGYLTRWAGLDLAIEAVARLRDEGVDLALTVLGEGPAREELEQLSTERRLDDRVTFVGRVPWPEVPQYLAGMDLGYSGQRRMAIGSMYHSPQKLYEYMAMRVPVVASDHPDARALTAGGGGWTFASEDLDELTEVLRSAAEQTEDRRRRGVVARETILAAHTWRSRVSDLMTELGSRGALR